MQTLNEIPSEFQLSPAGAEIRWLMRNQYGGMAHCTFRKNSVSSAVAHKTVSAFWHILSGSGAIWRRDSTGETITQLCTGVTLDIPVNTDFQYRTDEEDLIFLSVANPPTSGVEARHVQDSPWETTVSLSHHLDDL